MLAPLILALRELNATKLVSMGYGHVVASIGEMSGEMPYTAFNARKSYIEKNEEVLKKFTAAIAKGLEYCNEKSAKEIAQMIIDQFPDTSINDLISIVQRYKDADSWLETPKIEENLFENLESIMVDSKQIEKYVPFEDLVVNLYE